MSKLLKSGLKIRRGSELTIDTGSRLCEGCVMPTPLRIEYAGARYHVMSRGDRPEAKQQHRVTAALIHSIDTGDISSCLIYASNPDSVALVRCTWIANIDVEISSCNVSTSLKSYSDVVTSSCVVEKGS